MTATMPLEHRPSRRPMHGHPQWRQSSRHLLVSEPMKSIVLPSYHQRRISSLESSAMESIISDLTISQHNAFTAGGGIMMNTHESTFGKVFDAPFCQTESTPTPSRPQSSIGSPDYGGARSREIDEVQQQQETTDVEFSAQHRLMSALAQRRKNAPMPQRQASIPCLMCQDSSSQHNNNTSTHVPKLKQTFIIEQLVSSKEPSSQSILGGHDPSCHTFAEYKVRRESSSLRDLDSTMGSMDTFVTDCSNNILDLAEVDEFYLDDEDDDEAREDSWDCQSTKEEISPKSPVFSYEFPHVSQMVPHISKRRMMMKGRSASTRDMRTTTAHRTAPPSGLSLSDHQRTSSHALVVQSVNNAGHFAVRRKWAELSCVSVRHLAVHKEEQEKTLTETTENTEEDDDATEIDTLLGNAHAVPTVEGENGTEPLQDDNESVGNEYDHSPQSFCCPYAVCTRWLSCRDKMN